VRGWSRSSADLSASAPLQLIALNGGDAPMNTDDEFLRDMLRRMPTAKRLVITKRGDSINVKDFSKGIDLRARVAEFNMPLLEGLGYIATRQWDIATDTTAYCVVRTTG
jgi:hypothetical protein